MGGITTENTHAHACMCICTHAHVHRILAVQLAFCPSRICICGFNKTENLKRFCILKKEKYSVLNVNGPLSCYHPQNITYNCCLHSNYTVLGISHNLEMRQSTQKDMYRLYVNTLFNISTGALENVDIGGRHGDVLKSAPHQRIGTYAFKNMWLLGCYISKMWIR